MEERKKFLNPLNIVIAIFILSFSIALFYTGYITFKNMKAEDEYEKLVAEVLKQAQEWAIDNKISEVMHISVDKLIEEGYIDSDNDKGELLNPRLREDIMNCHTIYIEPYNSEYRIIFNEEEDCDLVDFEKLGITLIARNASGSIVKTGEWVSENVTLSLESVIDIENITWYKDGNLIKEYNDFKTIVIETEDVVVSTYAVNVVIDEIAYSMTFDIKIDKTAIESTN